MGLSPRTGGRYDDVPAPRALALFDALPCPRPRCLRLGSRRARHRVRAIHSFVDNAPFGSLFRKPPQAATPEAAEPAAKPMKLRKFMRKPVANAATRAVKQTDGTFKKVAVAKKAFARSSKHRRAAAVLASQTVQPAAAADAFASQAEASVRVVTPDEVNEIDLAAQGTPEAPAVNESATEVGTTEPASTTDGKGNAMQTAALEEQNSGFIVKPAQSQAAAPAQTVVASRAQPNPEQNSWFQSMLIVVGGAFAAASAAVRLLMA